MRSRSSRLFIVLLHLVGVSTNLPHNLLWGSSYWQGIVGVHPMAIFLESLQLDAGGGLDGLLERLRELGIHPEDVLSDPYWLQDEVDGKCFGTGGFSECGDANLWLLRKRKGGARTDGGSSTNSVGDDDQRRRDRDRRNTLSLLWHWIGRGRHGDGADDNNWGYALELVDGNFFTSAGSSSSVTSSSISAMVLETDNKTETNPDRRAKQKRSDSSPISGDCLIPSTLIRQNSQPRNREKEGREMQTLELGPCSLDEAWVWNINGDGVLMYDGAIHISTKQRQRLPAHEQQQKQSLVARVIQGSIPQLESNSWMSERYKRNSVTKKEEMDCMWRVGISAATVGPCLNNTLNLKAADPSLSSSASMLSMSKHIVSFSLVRYQASASSTQLPKISGPSRNMESSSGETVQSQTEGENESVSKTLSDRSNTETETVLHKLNTATSRAFSGPALHPELKPASQLLFATGNASPSTSQSSLTPIPRPKAKRLAFSSNLVGASPLTLGAAASTRRSKNFPGSQQLHCGDCRNHNILHHTSDPMGSPSSGTSIPYHDDVPHKPRKISTHSYIEASKDGIWVDPDTSLEYFTDLSTYLGHDRKETGRHTLMGVGQYTRTVFKIKVYGCALYVAKRDALADPGFVPFSDLSSDELRSSDDFYRHLMTNDEANGSFDRTLFIKTNMQLATDVMRNSLDADWKLLTPEHKNALISSSLNPRGAEKAMLQKISSDDNPSRCSCGQIAPEEYEADPSCCARGTELAFTWRKTGDLELRLDGRVMDTFADPELARGIFYEYLRGDDPMSMDARDKFADGFPFLLAPLAQVKGVSSPLLQYDNVGADSKKPTKQIQKKIQRFIGSIGDAVNSHVSSAVDWAQTGTEEMRKNTMKTAKAVGDSAQKLGANLDQKRVEAWENILAGSDEAARVVAARIPFLAEHLSILRSKKDSVTVDGMLDADGIQQSGKDIAERGCDNIARHHRVRLFPPQQDETDEIGVIINPTMNLTRRLFLYMVHFYLMLLLIVSFPGSYSTRLVVKRTGGSRSKSLSDEEMSSEDDHYSLFTTGKITPPLQGLEVSVKISDSEGTVPSSGMTKSLSYYL